MRKLIIEYYNENEKDIGCIARLLTNRKNDKVILFYYNISIVYRRLLSNISFIIKMENIISTGKRTHQLKMSKQRTSEEIKKDNIRIPKVTRSLKLADKWFNRDGSVYNDLGKLQSEMNFNQMKQENNVKEKLENITTELSLYKERDNEMESSDKQIIVYYLCISCIDFCYMICIFLYMMLYSEIWEIWNVYGRFRMLYGRF